MRSRTLLIVAPLLLVLAGCTATTTTTPTPTPTPVAAETPAPDTATAAIAPGEVEADTTLIVTTTATAGNGATLQLEMRVHQPIPFDDIANQTLPAAFVESCGATFNADLFSAEAWSFARANISAVPADASTAQWPADAVISVIPDATGTPLIGRGMLREAADSTTACAESKSFAAEGNGAIAIGSAGDNGVFTAWARQRYGFTATADVTLSDCSFTITDLGKQYGADEGWSAIGKGGSCTIGAS